MALKDKFRNIGAEKPKDMRDQESKMQKHTAGFMGNAKQRMKKY